MSESDRMIELLDALRAEVLASAAEGDGPEAINEALTRRGLDPMGVGRCAESSAREGLEAAASLGLLPSNLLLVTLMEALLGGTWSSGFLLGVAYAQDYARRHGDGV